MSNIVHSLINIRSHIEDLEGDYIPYRIEVVNWNEVHDRPAMLTLAEIFEIHPDALYHMPASSLKDIKTYTKIQMIEHLMIRKKASRRFFNPKIGRLTGKESREIWESSLRDWKMMQIRLRTIKHKKDTEQ